VRPANGADLHLGTGGTLTGRSRATHQLPEVVRKRSRLKERVLEKLQDLALLCRHGVIVVAILVGIG
jgi:hypothetical protein